MEGVTILAEKDHKRKLQIEYGELSSEAIELKEKIKIINAERLQNEKELEGLLREINELSIEVSLIENTKIKLVGALNEISKKKKSDEEAISKMYDKIEEGDDQCFEEYCYLIPKLVDANEKNLNEENQMRRKIIQKIEMEARIDSMLFYNNVQVKIFNQLREIKVEEYLFKE